ncbi:MAG: alpha/beta fold hydrolase [Rubrobacteraceae bacterium]
MGRADGRPIMTTFVLVHGGWHGAWCWERVAPLLRAAGHEVHTPTLTGLGERARLLAPEIDLETHVRDVADDLVGEDLSGVTLVGHSYGGMVVSGAADLAPDRIARLVFLDAFVPEDRQSLFDLLRPERREFYLEAARERGEGWRVPPPPPEALGVTDETEARWLAAMLTPQPIKTFEQPVSIANDAANTLHRTCIHCTAGPLAPSFAPFAARAKAAPGWSYREMETGHDAMLTAPEELSAILSELRDGENPPRTERKNQWTSRTG